MVEVLRAVDGACDGMRADRAASADRQRAADRVRRVRPPLVPARSRLGLELVPREHEELELAAPLGQRRVARAGAVPDRRTARRW